MMETMYTLKLGCDSLDHSVTDPAKCILFHTGKNCFLQLKIFWSSLISKILLGLWKFVLCECETVCLRFIWVWNCVSPFYVSVKLSVSALREWNYVSQYYVSVKLCLRFMWVWKCVSILLECETVCISFMWVWNCVSPFYVSVKMSVSALRECETVCLSFMWVWKCMFQLQGTI
jgi:hypothetical protein